MATGKQPPGSPGYQDRAEEFDGQPTSYWIEQVQQATDPDLRYRAHVALHAVLPPSNAAPLHTKGLIDSDPSIRAYAAKCLGETSRHTEGIDPSVQAPFGEAVGPLRECLQDPDPDVRFEAARALVRIGAEVDAAVPVLISLLKERGIQPLIRAAIAAVLGLVPEAANQSVPVLSQMLHDERTEVRENAAASLGEFAERARAAVPDLISLLDDNEPLVRENAARTLGRAAVGDPNAAAALQYAIQDEDEHVKTAAAQALQRVRIASG